MTKLTMDSNIATASQMSLPPLSEHCKPLAHPYWPTTTLAAFLVVGILISYIPQHLKIIQRRSSDGLSPWWVLLGGLSSVAAIGNILVLPTSRADMQCCSELSGSACAAALLGVAQIGVQWSCFMLIVMLYLLFFTSTAHPFPNQTSAAASLTKPTSSLSRRDPIMVACCILAAVFIVAVASPVLVFRNPRYTQTWADILGTIAGVLAAIQYLPQIYYTWILGDVKSLSVVTLIIQAPGAFVFALSLYLRVGAAGWSTWLVYIVTGVLQFFLLGMAISYWNTKRLRERHDPFVAAARVSRGGAIVNGRVVPEPDEHTSLLSSTHPRAPVS